MINRKIAWRKGGYFEKYDIVKSCQYLAILAIDWNIVFCSLKQKY